MRKFSFPELKKFFWRKSKLLQITKNQVQFLTTELLNSAIAWTTENLPSHTTNFGSVELAKGLFFFLLDLGGHPNIMKSVMIHDSWSHEAIADILATKKWLNIYIWLRTAVIKTCLKRFCLSFRMSSPHLRLNHTGSGNLPPRPTWCSVQQWGPSRRRWECLRRRASSAHCCLTEATPGKSAFLFSPSKHRTLASSRRISSSPDSEGKREVLLFSLSW